MAYDPKALANHLLDLASVEGRPLTLMQLLKMIYIAHGWSHAALGRPLVSESIEAWKHGPVIPSVYHEFKRFGATPITARAVEEDIYDFFAPSSMAAAKDGVVATPVSLPLNEDGMRIRDFIRRVWDSYKQFDGPQLMSLTHQPGTPWWKTWHDLGGRDRRHAIIDEREIRDHFVQKGLENQRVAQARADQKVPSGAR